MKESGLSVNSMVKGNISYPMMLLNLGNGRMAKELNGLKMNRNRNVKKMIKKKIKIDYY